MSARGPDPMRHFIQLLHVLFWSTKPPTSRESAMRWGFLRFRNLRNRSISVLQNRLEQFHRVASFDLVASFDFWHHRNLRTFRTWRESSLHRGFYISLRAQVCVSHWRQRGHLGGGEPKSKGSRSAYQTIQETSVEEWRQLWLGDVAIWRLGVCCSVQISGPEVCT